jgi:hypothetical protein
MPTTEDRELRRTTRGSGAAATAPKNTQNGGAAASSVTTKAKDVTKTMTLDTASTTAAKEVAVKRSESDLGDAKDDDEMDVDSMVEPESAVERNVQRKEIARESEREEVSQDER